MKIGLFSFSKDPAITTELLQRIAAALETQLYRDYAPAWQSNGVPVTVYATFDEIPADTSPLLIFDTSGQARDLGWHSVDAKGKAHGRAFWLPILKHGGDLLKGAMSLSATLSHEVLEMVGNPYVNFWCDVGDGSQEALELCDRVEGDAYDIDGISVSNFLTPRAFRNGEGPYDFLGLLTEPFEVREGGYAIRRGQDGEVYDVWSRHYLPWRRELKEQSPRLIARHAEAFATTQSAQLQKLLPGVSLGTAALLVTANEVGVLESTIDADRLHMAIADATPTETELENA